jgi:hypothetical protein
VVNAHTPNAVLDSLHTFATHIPLNVLGAARVPLGVGDWRTLKLGRDIFLHSSVARGWWDEYAMMTQREFDPGIIMARSSLMASMHDPYAGTPRVQFVSKMALKWPILRAQSITRTQGTS